MTNNKENIKNIKRIRICETDFKAEEQSVINMLRKEGKFIYHLRNSENNRGYLISKFAIINRIGFLISDTNLEEYMNGENFISDEDFYSIENVIIEHDHTLRLTNK